MRRANFRHIDASSHEPSPFTALALSRTRSTAFSSAGEGSGVRSVAEANEAVNVRYSPAIGSLTSHRLTCHKWERT